MYAQLKKTRLTDGSFVWSVIIGYNGIEAGELDCYSEVSAREVLGSIRAHTSISCLTSIIGE